MEKTIGGLLKSYDSGTLTRRQLINSLVLLAASGIPVSAAGLRGPN